jgi:hypothetical protein
MAENNGQAASLTDSILNQRFVILGVQKSVPDTIIYIELKQSVFRPKIAIAFAG